MTFYRLAVSLLALAAPMAVQAQVQRPSEDAGATMLEEGAQYGGRADGEQADGARAAPDDSITVLASGLWSRVDRVGQAISIVDAQDLAAVQGADVTRALRLLPGTSFTRNGGLGSFTGVSVRGAASERVLVLVDGVRVNDVAAPSGGFDFGSVTASGIERIELLRGSNSLVWGSDAIGGVLHVATRIVDGIEAAGEYGGDEQVSGSLALGDAGSGHAVGLAASYLHREGFSTAAAGTEADGFGQWALSGRGEIDAGGGWALFGSGRYAEGELEIDGFPAPDYIFADTAERQDMGQLSGRAGVEYARDGVTVIGAISHARTERDLLDEAFGDTPYYSTSGRSTRAETRARLGIADSFALNLGGEREWSRFGDGAVSASTGTGGVYAMAEYSGGPGRGQQLHLAAGIRRDEHDDFGGAWTLGGNGTIALSQSLRLRASYGEGFKAPTLYQLHSDYGNLALRPERSRSVDAGVEWRRQGLSASLTAFRRVSRDLIDYVSCYGESGGICANRPFGTYDNIGRARSQGMEVEAQAALTARIHARLAYALTDSRNRMTGRDLARRPHHAGTAMLDWEALARRLFIGADLRIVSGSYDDAFNTVRLGGHALLDLRARWALSERFELTGRIENASGESYQTAAGYATEGRAAFVGARMRL